MEDYYTLFDTQFHYSPENSAIVIYISRVFYSPDKYHPYIKVDMAKVDKGIMKSEFEESFTPPTTATDYLITVVKYEPYERDDIGRRVLEAIREVEEKRKKTSRLS